MGGNLMPNERVTLVVVDGTALLNAQEDIRRVGTAVADMRNAYSVPDEVVTAIDGLLQLTALFVSVEIDRRKSALHLK